MSCSKKILVFFIVLLVPVLFFMVASAAPSETGSAEGNSESTAEKKSYTGVGTVTAGEVNIRENPGIDEKILVRVSQGTKVTILGNSGNWYKVSWGDVTGWMHSEYVYAGNLVLAYINSADVNLREGPGTSSDILGCLDEGDRICILRRSENWYSVKTRDGTTGWIFNKYVTVNQTSVSRSLVDVTPDKSSKDQDKPDSSDSGNISDNARKAIDYAKKFIGVRYVYGGSSSKGFDCSGFVKYVYSNLGIDLERVAADQATQGTWVKRSELKAGDLVFFDTNGGHDYINHVGMYIGNGQFIHASSSRSTHCVTISNLNDSWYSNAYMTARRFIK